MPKVPRGTDEGQTSGKQNRLTKRRFRAVEAEDALKKAAEPSNVVQQYIKDNALLQVACERPGVRFGRQAFDVLLQNTFRRFDPNVTKRGIELQSTLALVYKSGSGVGKTFITLTARRGAQQLRDATFEVVSAYIGFSNGWELTANEQFLLQRGNELEIQGMVLARLLLVVEHFDLHAAQHGVGFRFLDEDNSSVQRQLTPYDDLGRRVYCAPASVHLVGTLKSRCYFLLPSMKRSFSAVGLVCQRTVPAGCCVACVNCSGRCTAINYRSVKPRNPLLWHRLLPVSIPIRSSKIQRLEIALCFRLSTTQLLSVKRALSRFCWIVTILTTEPCLERTSVSHYAR